jgi:hypothetical protein
MCRDVLLSVHTHCIYIHGLACVDGRMCAFRQCVSRRASPSVAPILFEMSLGRTWRRRL